MASPPPVRTRNARGEGARLRAEILVAAARLIEEGPTETLTLRAVARAAGITAPAIYRHFDSVDGIVRAVVEDAFDDLEETLRTAAVGSTAVERLGGVCAAYLRFATEHPEQYRLLFEGVWNAADLPPEREDERAERSRLGLDVLQVFVDAVADCIDEGSSASTDAFRDATALWVGLHGLAGLRRTAPLFRWPEGLHADLMRSLARLH